MSNDEAGTPSEPCDDTSLDADNQVTRDVMWRSAIDGIAAEAVRDYEALVEHAAKACPPYPPPSKCFLAREHLGQPWGADWLRFEADMTRIGMTIHEAQTPGGWGGPAVSVPRAQVFAVIAATGVGLEHHGVGEMVVLYPAPAWI